MNDFVTYFPGEPSTHEHREPAQWADVFFAMAKAMAERSKDPSTQCGAVLVTKNNRIISTGFNGPPESMMDECVPWNIRPQKYAYIIHAEENAIWHAVEMGGKQALIESKLYCTHFPCTECVLRMIRSKIRHVFVPRNHVPYPMSKYQVEVSELLARQRFPKLEINLV